MKKTLRIAIACITLLFSPLTTAEEAYPNRPIRIIVQFGAGTSTDIVARIVGQKLAESVGQPVVVENKVGGGGIIGTEVAAKATPDGYTLVMAVSSVFGIDPSLYKALPFDVLRDFAPITNLVTVPQILVVPKNGPDTVQDLVKLARARQGEVAYGSLRISLNVTGGFAKA